MNCTDPPAAGGGPAARRPLEAALYFVSTPIGAARDITLRALDILAQADVIAAEDTRTARKLMEIHGIALGGRPVVAYHDHSGAPERARLVAAVAEGRSVAYVSEAGTPLVADPGYALGRAMVAAGQRVLAAPGASAVLAALAVAGLPTDRFVFAGFLPSTAQARRTELEGLKALDMTLVLYESPKRVRELLGDMLQSLGDREAVVCRELTKRFEEVERGTLSALVERFKGRTVKGEVVVVVGKPVAGTATDEDIERALAVALQGTRLKEAAGLVAEALGVARRRVYQIGLGSRATGRSGDTTE